MRFENYALAIIMKTAEQSIYIDYSFKRRRDELTDMGLRNQFLHSIQSSNRLENTSKDGLVYGVNLIKWLAQPFFQKTFSEGSHCMIDILEQRIRGWIRWVWKNVKIPQRYRIENHVRLGWHFFQLIRNEGNKLVSLSIDIVNQIEFMLAHEQSGNTASMQISRAQIQR